MMKVLVIFVLAFLSCCEANTFSSAEEKQVLDLLSQNIDYFFDNFDRIMGKFLRDQHQSVAEPVREFAYCIYNNHSETLKTSLITLASAVVKNESLEERQKLCEKPQNKAIFDLYSCADVIKPSTELTEIFHSMVYFPFRTICNAKEFTNYAPNKTFIAFSNCTECPSIIAKLSEIINDARKPTKEDECLPIQFAKAFRYSVASEYTELETMDLEMIQELVRFYITVQAKLPFASYVDCYNNL